MGAELVAVSPQKPEHLQAIVNTNKLTFAVVSDAGNKLAEAFGLKFALPAYLSTLYAGFGIDLLRFNGDNSLTLPMSARYLIGQNGVIAAADFDPDYTIRPEPSKTIADLRSLPEL